MVPLPDGRGSGAPFPDGSGLGDPLIHIRGSVCLPAHSHSRLRLLARSFAFAVLFAYPLIHIRSSVCSPRIRIRGSISEELFLRLMIRTVGGLPKSV